jgi:hypothetical protein
MIYKFKVLNGVLGFTENLYAYIEQLQTEYPDYQVDSIQVLPLKGSEAVLVQVNLDT